jgi:hypothetical protein
MLWDHGDRRYRIEAKAEARCRSGALLLQTRSHSGERLLASTAEAEVTMVHGVRGDAMSPPFDRGIP